MNNYYFLASALPQIRLGEPLEMGYGELKYLIDVNVFGEDFEQVKVVRMFFDINNMLALWIGNDVTPYGNFDIEELEEALVTGVGLPDYVVSFLEKYEEREQRIANFPKLAIDFFNEEVAHTSGFLKRYLELEHSTRLILTALRAKELHRDILRELQFEDPNDDLVAQILSQKDAKTYEPPAEWSNLKAYWEAHKDNPMDLFQAQVQFRYEQVEEMLGVDLFSIERVLGYMIQLISAEQWLAMDRKKGNEILDSIVKETV